MRATRGHRRATAPVACALLAVVLVAAGFPGAQSTSSASVGTLRAAVLMPYTDGGRTGPESPATHAATFNAGFAWDLPNGPGAPVYARLASADGPVTIAVGDTGTNAHGAGSWVQVDVFVTGTQVGTLYYEHLANVQVASHARYPAGQLLGYTGSGTFPATSCVDGTADGWPSSPDWQVCTPDGIQTRVDVTRGCWRPLDTNADVSPDDQIALLSAQLPTNGDAACDTAELGAVNAAAQSATPVAAAVRAAPVVQRQDGSIHVFADGDDGELLHKWLGATGGWQPSSGVFETLGSEVAGTPAALVRKNGTLDVFARGADGALLHKWLRTSGTWQPSGRFEVLGSGLAGDPQAIQTADGTVHVFARDQAGGLVHAWLETSGGWQPSPFGPPEVLGAGLTGDPVMAQRQDGTVDVFARGSGGELLHKWLGATGGWQPSPFGSFQSLGSGLAGSPAALVRDDGTLDVFARGDGGGLLHKWLPGAGGWQPSASGSFALMGAGLGGDPQAIQTADGITNVFARDAAGGLAHKWIQAGGDWRPSPGGPFEVLGAGTTGSSALVQRQSGWLDLFVRSTTGELAHKWFGVDIRWQPSQFGPFEKLGSGLGAASFHVETPAAPAGVAATAGERAATVSWAPPGFDGNGAILDYEVRSSPDDIAQRVAWPATSLVVGGLREGVAYTFTARARNAVGDGPPSRSNAVTPTGPPPPPTTTTTPTTTTPTTTTPTTTTPTTTTTTPTTTSAATTSPATTSSTTTTPPPAASTAPGTTVPTTTPAPAAKKPRTRCSVPSVRGKTPAAAKAALRAHHCRVGSIKKASSSRRMRGRVTAQAPLAGAVRADQTRVNLWLGSGPKR